jgi:hypothetical protein
VIRLLGIGAVVFASVVVAAPAAGAEAGRGPFLLVALPSLGTVTWSCGGSGAHHVALGFRVNPIAATTAVAFIAGQTNRKVTLQPGQSTRFPLLAPGKQRLAIAQATEARLLRATVVATFSPDQSYCFPYFPPRISVAVWRVRR